MAENKSIQEWFSDMANASSLGEAIAEALRAIAQKKAKEEKKDEKGRVVEWAEAEAPFEEKGKKKPKPNRAVYWEPFSGIRMVSRPKKGKGSGDSGGQPVLVSVKIPKEMRGATAYGNVGPMRVPTEPRALSPEDWEQIYRAQEEANARATQEEMLRNLQAAATSATSSVPTEADLDDALREMLAWQIYSKAFEPALSQEEAALVKQYREALEGLNKPLPPPDAMQSELQSRLMDMIRAQSAALSEGAAAARRDKFISTQAALQSQAVENALRGLREAGARAGYVNPALDTQAAKLRMAAAGNIGSALTSYDLGATEQDRAARQQLSSAIQSALAQQQDQERYRQQEDINRRARWMDAMMNFVNWSRGIRQQPMGATQYLSMLQALKGVF